MVGRILAGAMADMPIINHPRLRYQWQPHKISIRRWINPYRNVTVDWIRLLYDDNGKLDWIRTFKTSTPIDFEAEDWNRYRVKFDNQKYVVSKIINWIEWFDWQEAMVGEDLNSRIDETKWWIEQAREESQEEGYDGKIFINVDNRAYRIVEPNSDSIATMEISISGCKYSFIAYIETDPESWDSAVVIDFLD